jgi:hypothetical protein
MNIALWVAVVGGLFSVGVVFITKFLESRSANTAILAEIQRLLKVIESHKKWWEDCIKSRETDLPLTQFTTPIFDAQVENIGNIDRQMVAKVVAFYGWVKFINAIQGEKAKYPQTARGAKFNDQYLNILGDVLARYKGTFDNAFRKYGLQ